MQYTEITLTQYFGGDDEYNNSQTICVEKPDMCISGYVNDLIRPLLLAHGFSIDLVNEYVPDAGDC